MRFLPVGYAMMAASGLLAIGALSTAVWRRSWSLWLLAFALLVLAAGVAWRYRTPSPVVPAAESR